MDYEFLSESRDMQETSGTCRFIKELESGVMLERSEVQADQLGQLEQDDLTAGTPETDVESWHLQSEANSCAVCCQEFVAEQLLEQDFSEQKMVEYATEQGWYNKETGTTMSDVGNLLETLGLEVERESGLMLSDLFGELENGHKIICGVNNMVLENPELAELPGCQANHAVEVIGIDYSNPEQVQVVLNDSGVENGMGRSVSADTFLKSWETSGRYTVTSWKGES